MKLHWSVWHRKHAQSKQWICLACVPESGIEMSVVREAGKPLFVGVSVGTWHVSFRCDRGEVVAKRTALRVAKSLRMLRTRIFREAVK